MVAGVFHMGGWKSLRELEDSITMRELELLMDARNKGEERNQRFQAALKGIDLNENEHKETFEDIEKQAQAILAGKNSEDADSHEEETFFADIGIDVETM